jgi:hypothetical protein
MTRANCRAGAPPAKPRAVNSHQRLASDAVALQLLFLVELEPVRPIFPLLDEACANRILLEVKPFRVKRLIGAYKRSKQPGCHSQEAFKPFRIHRFSAAEKLPSRPSRLLGATTTLR